MFMEKEKKRKKERERGREKRRKRIREKKQPDSIIFGQFRLKSPLNLTRPDPTRAHLTYALVET